MRLIIDELIQWVHLLSCSSYPLVLDGLSPGIVYCLLVAPTASQRQVSCLASGVGNQDCWVAHNARLMKQLVVIDAERRATNLTWIETPPVGSSERVGSDSIKLLLASTDIKQILHFVNNAPTRTPQDNGRELRSNLLSSSLCGVDAMGKVSTERKRKRACASSFYTPISTLLIYTWYYWSILVHMTFTPWHLNMIYMLTNIDSYAY